MIIYSEFEVCYVFGWVVLWFDMLFYFVSSFLDFVIGGALGSLHMCVLWVCWLFDSLVVGLCCLSFWFCAWTYLVAMGLPRFDGGLDVCMFVCAWGGVFY